MKIHMNHNDYNYYSNGVVTNTFTSSIQYEHVTTGESMYSISTNWLI